MSKSTAYDQMLGKYCDLTSFAIKFDLTLKVKVTFCPLWLIMGATSQNQFKTTNIL